VITELFEVYIDFRTPEFVQQKFENLVEVLHPFKSVIEALGFVLP
jgi:hypothetical protein